MSRTIAVVGAGAKAAAIVARAAVLRSLGVNNIPEILVFEEFDVGYAWSGDGGFSSGFVTLCTPGEKDVGFPYDETIVKGAALSSVSSVLFCYFSWTAFLVSTGRMSEWVDRGRQNPTHNIWAQYLKWVFEVARQKTIPGKVAKIRPVNNMWEISYVEKGVTDRTLADGVVITGTGCPNLVPIDSGVPSDRVFDAETFWANRKPLLKLEEGTIAVAGDGGAAGAIVAWLAEHFRESLVSIVSISPLGTLLPRGDGYAERRWFSDPSDWQGLSFAQRHALMDHTEAGVISLRNKKLIDISPNIAYRWGKATKVTWNYGELFIEIEHNKKNGRLGADYFVSAIGFDRWSLLELIAHTSIKSLRDRHPLGKTRRLEVEENMMDDLSLPPLSGLPSGMHIPALASLAHGPGISNLGCLGLMAAAVLRPYVK